MKTITSQHEDAHHQQSNSSGQGKSECHSWSVSWKNRLLHKMLARSRPSRSSQHFLVVTGFAPVSDALRAISRWKQIQTTVYLPYDKV